MMLTSQVNNFGSEKYMTHAFLIMAYRDIDLLNQSIRTLDKEHNLIYIHIDKKSFLNEDNINKPRFATMKIFKEFKVIWGTDSFTKVEIFLLEKAVSIGADYYHLLSEADLLIKEAKEFYRFFEENKGKEFVHFEDKVIKDRYLERVRYFHFFRQYAFLINNRYFNQLVYDLEMLSLWIQKKIKVNRKKRYEIMQKGCNWFSITDELANYVISLKEHILNSAKNTLLFEEMFLQTIIVNSNFVNNLYAPDDLSRNRSCLREIDWIRGNPYIFKMEDYEYLLKSECFFARKFNSKIDNEIINFIVKRNM